MRRICLLLLAALPVFPAFAEGAPFKITAIEAKHPGDDTVYRFPNLQGREPAASAINIWLQAVELQKLPGRYRKAAFEDIWPKDGDNTGVTELNFAAGEINARYVSIGLNGEYTSASLSDFTKKYSFDSASGAPIGLHDLLTPVGFAQVRSQAATKRVALVRDYLKTLPSQKDEDAADKKALYENCLPEIRADDLEADDLELRPGKLTLSRGSCATRGDIALDDLGEMEVAFPVADLAAGLSDYGRCILGLAPSTPCVKPHGAQLESGVYRGTIGKTPVTLVVGELRGRHARQLGYFYDKYAKWIELAGEQRPDGAFWFREASGDDGKETGRFVLHADAEGRLGGDWSSAQGGKALAVLLAPIDLPAAPAK